jgi:hypothetical protein
VADFLSSIRVKFILITGKCQLPSLEKSIYVQKILDSSNLLVWFSQNQIFMDLPILPFPFGVNFKTAPLILSQIEKESTKVDELLIPFVKIHPHLQGSPRLEREVVSSFMDRYKPIKKYLEDLSLHKWVISPAGDRPDTYRHWEIISLGSIVVSKLPLKFKSLFNNSVFLLPSYNNILELELPSDSFPNSHLATLEHWRNRVNQFRNLL